MRPGDLVQVLPVAWDNGALQGRGTLVAIRKQRTEVGYLVRLDGEEKALYFGPLRVIPLSEESQQHIVAGE